MGTPLDPFDAGTHRRLGIDLFNETWTLMKKETRTREDDDELLHCAHASAYHWLQVGTTAHRARSEWQCSRAYAVLGRAEPALHHARRCLELAESGADELEDWDLAAAREALARAALVAGDEAEVRRQLGLAREAVAGIADPEDRESIEAEVTALAAQLDC